MIEDIKQPQVFLPQGQALNDVSVVLVPPARHKVHRPDRLKNQSYSLTGNTKPALLGFYITDSKHSVSIAEVIYMSPTDFPLPENKLCTKGHNIYESWSIEMKTGFNLYL